MDKTTNQPVVAAGIYNTGSMLLAKSNLMGEFALQVWNGDSLIIRKQGFTDYYIRVYNSQDLVIKLQPVIRLSEVNVTSQTKKQELDEINKQYRKKGSYYGGKPPLLSYVFTPLTALYELIGKTPGQARRFRKYYYRELEQSEIDRRFNAFVIKKYCGLEGKEAQDFMDHYRPQYVQLSSWDEYQLLSYIKISSGKFIEDGKPSGKSALPALPKAPDLRVKIKAD